ncbi:MAG TPA: T9SS type A sorting domain-containing protein [Bacteroidales bacterium]|mgnify:CR=1 FL=1|nr:T9SS type A sorting domain-containing protein [Bacteroidales bacterium]
MKTKVNFILVLLGLFLCAPGSYAQSFQANPDTIYLTPGITDTIDLLANDIIPAGDSIIIQSLSTAPVKRFFVNPEKTLVGFYVDWREVTSKVVTGHYTLWRKNTLENSTTTITFYVDDESFDSIDLNNISARFMANGCHYNGNGNVFEVPRGSGKGTLFLHSIWLGGNDQNDQLHLAGARYGQGPTGLTAMTNFDFWAGPVMDSAKYQQYDTVWNYVWKINKSEIEYHKANWNKSGYEPIHDILTWPGNGNVAAGQAARLAPFIDADQDGIYDPFSGDYPNIRGDQGLYYIINDDREFHAETWGNKLRTEIHTMAYAFKIPGDTAFDNTVFVNYRVINRSQNTYSNTYFGVFADFDIGMWSDDYVGCDVERGMFFGYNGRPVDGSGEPQAYGEHPPAQAIVFLGGPLLPVDQRDNPAYIPGNCDIMNTGYPNDPYAINGAGFGDSLVDNERMGMSHFVYFNNGGADYMRDPKYANDYFLYLQGKWLDTTQMIYGGNGHISSGGYGPECNFMFPALSDGCDWGTNGQAPNGEKNWTEKTAGNNPADRRGLGSAGPFTMAPGEEVTFDLAYVFARDTTAEDTTQSLNALGKSVDKIRNAFFSNTLPNGNPFLGISSKPVDHTWNVNVYPNPASAVITVALPEASREAVTITLKDVKGSQVKSMTLPNGVTSATVNVMGISPGLYFLTVQTDEYCVTKKVMIIR